MFCLFNNCLEKYLSKNPSKTFSELVLTLITTLNKQLTAPGVMILNKYTVVCNVFFNKHHFYFPDFESIWRK